MIVSEASFAAAAVVPADGRREDRIFDDLGCLFAWEAGGDRTVTARWTGTQDAGWVRAESAWYVRSPDIRSPMGSGVAAYSSRAAAERAAGEKKGTLLDWNAVRAIASEQGLLAPPPEG